MKAIQLILIAIFWVLCSCSEPKSEMQPSVINDPYISSARDVIIYLEAVASVGSTKAIVNGHTWTFHEPFHSGFSGNVLLSPPSKTFEINEESQGTEMRAWLKENKENWVRYVPSARTSGKNFWNVVDLMEGMRIYYSIGYVEDASINAPRLEALKPNKTGSNQAR